LTRTSDAAPGDSPFYVEKKNLTVAQLLLDYLRLEGVTKLFGVPGAAILPLKYELHEQRQSFDFVVCRHETGAAYIAHGYSIVADALGVVITTTGPGATNALTGAMNAQSAGAQLLVITGEVGRKYAGRGYLQAGIDARLNVDAIYQNAVQTSVLVADQSDFATLIEQALRDARTLPGRTAHVGLPVDVAGACVETGQMDAQGNNIIRLPKSPDRYRATPSGTDLARITTALDVLLAADRPLLFLGNGARRALRDPARLGAFTAFVEKFAIPVVTSPDGKGVFPETHALSLRNYGMTACNWPQRYMHPVGAPGHDALMVLGSSLGELATMTMTELYSQTLVPSRHFIQVDLDQSVIGRNFPITLGIVADVGGSIDAMCSAGADRPAPASTADRRAAVAAIKRDPDSAFYNADWRNSNTAPVNPAAMMRVIGEEMTAGHIFIDAGNSVGWSLNNLVVSPPLHYHSSLGMGPMGYGAGAVVGGKMAAPDQACLAIVGDGGFLMHGAEVSTAAQGCVGAVWVVLYDNDLAMSSQGMAIAYPPSQQWFDYYRLGAPDLVQFAAGLGADAVGVTSAEGPGVFREALRLALRRAEVDKKPQVIVVHIDPHVGPPYGGVVIGPPKCGPAT
jgi:acetolactate synthase-1/2/3 large subunit